MEVDSDVVADGKVMKSEEKERKTRRERSGINEIVNMAYVKVAWV